VNRWVGRFALHRLDGLNDCAGRGRKPRLPQTAVQQVVEQAVTPPPHLGGGVAARRPAPPGSRRPACSAFRRPVSSRSSTAAVSTTFLESTRGCPQETLCLLADREDLVDCRGHSRMVVLPRKTDVPRQIALANDYDRISGT